MARKRASLPSDIQEGYPRSFERDGIDTGREIGGAMQEAIRVERPVKTWRNSRTGEPMERPEWDRDYDGV